MLVVHKCILKIVCTSQGLSKVETLIEIVVYTFDQTRSCVFRACQVLNLLHKTLQCLLPHFCTTDVSCSYSVSGAWFLA
jgi:hypothetical protein